MSMAVVKADHLRVLLVEDSVLITLDLQNILEAAGHFVVGMSPSKREAIKLVQALDIDVAVVDCVLEDGDCLQVIEALQAKRIPFVFCTGTTRHDFVRSHPRALCLSKPYTPDAVTSAVAQAVA